MVRCASLFSQLIAVFNRNEFYRLVIKHKAERYSKGFNSWDHFVAMLFCQIAQAKSLREICGGLSCCIGKLRHLGMKDSPKKSTLSYANAQRPSDPRHLQTFSPWKTQISVQKQVTVVRQFHHIPLPVFIPMGQISKDQGGC